jgi:hypothetical protein
MKQSPVRSAWRKMSRQRAPKPSTKPPKPKGAVVRVPTAEQLDAFFNHVTVDDAGCWIWTGPVTDAGLPKFGFCPLAPEGQPDARLPVKVPLGHRTSFAWFRGVLLPYPYWKVDQKCGARKCVRPGHLRQVRVPQKGELMLSTDRLKMIFEHVTRTDKGCWYWTGSINASGYAVQRFDDASLRAVDSVLYDWFVGYGVGQAPHEIRYSVRPDAPKAPQLLHVCLSRACVNPAHMNLVPHGQRWTAERIAVGAEKDALTEGTEA